jgi:probable phosphoglycerate mutase
MGGDGSGKWQRGRAACIALLACLPMLALAAAGAESASAGGAAPMRGEAVRLVYLIRHGEAAYYAADGSEVADTDVVGLTARGVAQVGALAQWLRTRGVTGVDRLLVSPLPRAQQTGRLLVEQLGLAPSSLQTVAALRELPAGDGPTVAAARAAALAELERLRRADGWQTALIVAHGGVHRSLLARALTGQDGVPVRAALDNACLHLLELRPDGDWLVRGANLCADAGGPAQTVK